MPTLIEFKNVVKEYENGDQFIKVANNLNFTIDKGELVIILGPSGSGKSTLLNLLGGLDKVTSGDIIVNGEKISNFSEKELTQYRAKEIGFIFQFYNILPSLTVKENVDIVKDIVKNPISTEEALKGVGLEKHAKKFPNQLSGNKFLNLSLLTCKSLKVVQLSSSYLTSSNNLYLLNDR